MDALGVYMKSSKRHKERNSNKAIKVVYISSPMKVKTTASQFRALVQELTGKDSDATERFMDVNYASQVSNETIDLNQGANALDDHNVHAYMDLPPLMGSSSQETSTSSDSIFEPFDAFLPPVEGDFMSMPQSNFFHESFELDWLSV